MMCTASTHSYVASVYKDEKAYIYIRMCMHDKHAMYIFTRVKRIAAGESDKVERTREMYLPIEHGSRGTYTQQLRQL